MIRRRHLGCLTETVIEAAVGVVVLGIIYVVVSGFCPDDCSVDFDPMWATFECVCPDSSTSPSE